MDSRFFNSLQVFRGVAAMMVVFHHSWNNIRHYYHVRIPVLDVLLGFGKYGVDFFFVLSGFIICYSNFRFAESPQHLPLYLKNRLTRIFVPYWPIGLLMLLLYIVLPGVSGNVRDVSVIKSLFLLPVSGSTALSVAWTLVFELFFYSLFMVWFFSRRTLFVVLTGWLAVIVVFNMFFSQSDIFIFRFVGSHYNVEFIMGVCAALFFKSSYFNRSSAVAMIGIAAASAIAIPGLTPVGMHLIAGLCCTGILLLSINTPLDRLKPANILMIVGNASYSLYLVHNPIISFSLRIFRRFELMHFSFVLIAVLLTCLIGGILYSSIFEQFALQRIKKMLMLEKKTAT
jgi:exopolysaccharide production protein ExoZ